MKEHRDPYNSKPVLLKKEWSTCEDSSSRRIRTSISSDTVSDTMQASNDHEWCDCGACVEYHRGIAQENHQLECSDRVCPPRITTRICEESKKLRSGTCQESGLPGEVKQSVAKNPLYKSKQRSLRRSCSRMRWSTLHRWNVWLAEARLES